MEDTEEGGRGLKEEEEDAYEDEVDVKEEENLKIVSIRKSIFLDEIRTHRNDRKRSAFGIRLIH